MKAYDSHTMGKLVIQDWDVVAGYPDVPLLYILTPQQAAALVAICPQQKWLTRWENPPTKDTLDAFIAETMFNLMNPITCAMLQECIGELIDAQTTTIITALENFTKYGSNNPGQPFPNELIIENLAGGTNPGCDLDILWAQCLALVQFTNRAAEDIFQKIEAATNVVELAGLIDAIPVIGVIAEQFGATLSTDAINYFQEALAEGYSAEYTEALEYELACLLFCVCRGDCVITIDRIYDVFYSNVADIVPDNPLDWVTLLALLAGIDVTEDTVVSLVFWMLWGSAKLGQMMFSTVTVTFFQTLMELAVDDASSDWEILCLSCTNYEVLQFNVYTGGSPVDTREEDWGEQTFNALTEDPGPEYILRLEFVPAVKLNYVSHTGSLSSVGGNPAEDYYDWVDFENTFVFFDGTDIPAVAEFDGRCLKRLYMQSMLPFTVTIDVQPADCEPTP